MSKPVIAIDVDDVLAHSIESFRLQVNARAGAQLTREHFMVPGEYHHYLDRVLETNGVDYATIKDDLFLGMSNDQSHIPPQPGAVKVLQKLAREYELVVITARAPEWEAQTHVWLQMHFPGVFKEVHFAGNRHDPIQKSKGDMCVEAGAAYLIDDNPEHAVSAEAKGVQVILFGEYGWQIDVPEDMKQCKTWSEVEQYFDGQRSRQ
jgi:5'(3')-deoxyribonucleotidase